MSRRLVVFPNDPLYRYVEKGEVKPRYYNPENLFDEVHMVTWCEQDIGPGKAHILVGKAKPHVHAVGRPTVLNLFRQLAGARRLAALTQPHVVRAHNPWQAGLLGLRVARCAQAPLVVSVHDDYDARRRIFGGFRLRALEHIEKYVLSRAQVVICVSEHLRGYARRKGAREVRVIYNRVFHEQFAADRWAARKDNGTPLCVLCVGRLDPQKRQDILIRAVAGLDCQLHLVGMGSREAELRELVGSLGSDGKVVFEPSVPHSEIPARYARADVFAIATEHEGFCMPVLEAMASGLPVVVCDTPPLPEVLGGCGLVVKKAPGAFREAIAKLAADPGLRRELGERAAARARELDGSIMERREAELYERLLRG